MREPRTKAGRRLLSLAAENELPAWSDPWTDRDMNALAESILAIEDEASGDSREAEPAGLDELRSALWLWKCPSCGGAGTYKQKGKATAYEVVEVPCLVCQGNGLHPTASAALVAQTPQEDT